MEGAFDMSASPTPEKRKFIDCREYPSEKNCSVKISGTEDEVLELAVLHAASHHGHTHSNDLREEIRKLLKDE